MIRTEVTSYKFRPDFYAVYVIEDPVFGFLAGFKPDWQPRVPMWCKELGGAEKFDSFRDLDAKGKALAIREHHLKDAKVWCYRRCDIFPEEYGLKSDD